MIWTLCVQSASFHTQLLYHFLCGRLLSNSWYYLMKKKRHMYSITLHLLVWKINNSGPGQSVYSLRYAQSVEKWLNGHALWSKRIMVVWKRSTCNVQRRCAVHGLFQPMPGDTKATWWMIDCLGIPSPVDLPPNTFSRILSGRSESVYSHVRSDLAHTKLI